MKVLKKKPQPNVNGSKIAQQTSPLSQYRMPSNSWRCHLYINFDEMFY